MRYRVPPPAVGDGHDLRRVGPWPHRPPPPPEVARGEGLPTDTSNTELATVPRDTLLMYLELLRVRPVMDMGEMADTGDPSSTTKFDDAMARGGLVWGWMWRGVCVLRNRRCCLSPLQRGGCAGAVDGHRPDKRAER
jgi:hypothetical protein